MTALLALLQLAALGSGNLMTQANSRLSAIEPAQPAPGARWRIDHEIPDDPTAKDRAIADDGSKCSVVGAKVCTRRPRTLLRAEILND